MTEDKLKIQTERYRN